MKNRLIYQSRIAFVMKYHVKNIIIMLKSEIMDYPIVVTLTFDNKFPTPNVANYFITSGHLRHRYTSARQQISPPQQQAKNINDFVKT